MLVIVIMRRVVSGACAGLMLTGEMPQHVGTLEGEPVNLGAAPEAAREVSSQGFRSPPGQRRKSRAKGALPSFPPSLWGCHFLAQAPISSSFPTLPNLSLLLQKLRKCSQGCWRGFEVAGSTTNSPTLSPGA